MTSEAASRSGAGTPGVEPDDIGPDYVPALDPRIVTIPVGDEAVLYEDDTGALHQLDRVATLVHAFFDGGTPIADIVDELAPIFSVERERIEADVTAMVRHFARAGLLRGMHGGERSVVEVDDGC